MIHILEGELFSYVNSFSQSLGAALNFQSRTKWTHTLFDSKGYTISDSLRGLLCRFLTDKRLSQPLGKCPECGFSDGLWPTHPSLTRVEELYNVQKQISMSSIYV